MRSRLAPAALAFCLALSGAAPAGAEMIGTAVLLEPSAGTERVTVAAFIARSEVQRQLVAHGVDPANAAARVASLTPAELQVLSSRIDSLPAGGATLSTLELILIILLIVLLI